jgi:general stress protein YciG
VAKEDRGFASMDRAKQREIASKGGKAAHQKGTAHEWTSEEARDAGRKGGIASHQRRREAMNKTSPAAETTTGAAGDSDMQNRESGGAGERSSSFERPDRTSDFAGNERTETER